MRGSHPKEADHIEECLTCLAFPEPHRRRIQTTNGPERFNQELKLGTRVVRIFPSREANHVFGRVGDNHTRPIVMIDEEHRDLYMFATAPCCDGGAIYYKKTALANISFPEGVGTPFIQSANDTHINNATSTKQNLNSTAGLMVLASDDTSQYYGHNFTHLSNTSDTTPPETTIDSGPSGTLSSSSASFTFSSEEAGSTFECKLDAGTFASCTSPQAYDGLSNGSHTFEVRTTDVVGNSDATPASRTWTVDTPQPLGSSQALQITKISENALRTKYGATSSLGADGQEPTDSGKDVYALIRWDFLGSHRRITQSQMNTLRYAECGQRTCALHHGQHRIAGP